MMQYVLHIDTSAAHALVMLSVDEDISSIQSIHNPFDQSAQINGMIERVLQEGDIQWHQLAAVSVVNGPGSYTGLRVGLATAKAIAFALQIPLILHHKLLLMLDQVDHDAIGIIHARVGEVYAAAKKHNMIAIQPKHMFWQELEQFLSANTGLTIVAEEPILNLCASFAQPKLLITEDQPYQKEHLIQRSLQRIERREFDELFYAAPFYLKQAYTTTPKK